jgi:hypothetical protein
MSTTTAPRTQAGSRPRLLPRDWGAAVALALLVVGGALGVAYASGAMGTPYGDDWSYARIAFHFYNSGDLVLNGWEAMTLVAHLLWAFPFMAVFGTSLEALQWATATAAVIGLVAAFAVLRRFLSPRAALFGTALVAILPTYGYLVPTYMTDTTAFAAEMVCLALGLGGLDVEGRRRWLLLAASLGIGLFGFAARDIAIAAPVAVLAAHLLAAHRAGAGIRHMVWPLATLLIAAGAFLAWRHGLPGSYDQEAGTPGLHSAYVVAQGYFTLALGLLPALVAAAITARRERFNLSLAGGAGGAVALAALVVIRQLRRDDPIELLRGDVFGRSWKLPSELPLADSQSPFLPGAVWAAIDVLALVGGVLLAVLLVRAAAEGLRRFRAREAWDPSSLAIVLFGLLYAGALAVWGLRDTQVYDRYFWALTVPLLVLALGGLRPLTSGRHVRAPALVTAGLLAVLTVVCVVHETASRGAEWDVGEEAVAAGARVRDVDAGYAWVGYHDSGPVGTGRASPSWKYPRPWYGSLFPDAGNCLSTSKVPLADPRLRLVAVHKFRWVPGLGQERIWLYRNRPDGVPCDPAHRR